jgi:hypothetical protein
MSLNSKSEIHNVFKVFMSLNSKFEIRNSKFLSIPPILLLSAALSLLPGTGLASSDLRDLPLSHWSNPVLDRFNARGYLTLSETRPYRRDEVAASLSKFLNRVRSGEFILSDADLYNLKRLTQEFLPDAGFEKRRLVERDLVHYGTDKVFAGGDIAATGITTVSRLTSPVYQGRFDLDMWGSTGKSFVFDQKFTAVIEKENEREVRTAPNVMSWRGGKLLTDWSYFRFKMPWFTATLGRSQKWWGPGRFGTLLLSDNAPAFDALDLAFSFKRVGFHAFAGILSTEQERYLSGHRLTIAVPGRVDLGFSEVVVYQAPNMLPAYVNPLLPYYAVQWNERGDDNILWAMDAAWRPGYGMKWYAELLMDDVIYEQGRTPAPQKLGFLAGLAWADPVRLRDTDLKMEYAGNLKWVYTHRRYDNRYVGSDTASVLGHWLGPDAEALSVTLEHRFHPRLNLGCGYELVNHGEGAVGMAHDPLRDGTRTEFLSGVVERQSLGTVLIDWSPFYWMTMNLKGRFGKAGNVGHISGVEQDISSGSLSLKLDW